MPQASRAGGAPDASARLLRSIERLAEIESEAASRSAEKREGQGRKAEEARQAMLAAVRASRWPSPESRGAPGGGGGGAARAAAGAAAALSKRVRFPEHAP